MLMLLNYNSSVEGPVLAVNAFVDFSGQSIGKLLLLKYLAHKCLRIYCLALLSCPQGEDQLTIVLDVYFENPFD